MLWVAVGFACIVSLTFVGMMWRIIRRNRADYAPDELDARIIRHMHHQLVMRAEHGLTPAEITLSMLWRASTGQVVKETRKTFIPDAPDSVTAPESTPRLAS
ncbi:hypothetical protein UFOVP1122_36 [uncultured Caudovirales phage]|uniref:Uncharacterized protein n=1 Tax=uncultured Caudovirales phage TaxID=2100421 RepID=A0A6J5QTU8_9CAUD|nr:hypothetical protein UFOVP1122_36 [uncultured Caudovirales phage]